MTGRSVSVPFPSLHNCFNTCPRGCGLAEGLHRSVWLVSSALLSCGGQIRSSERREVALTDGSITVTVGETLLSNAERLSVCVRCRRTRQSISFSHCRQIPWKGWTQQLVSLRVELKHLSTDLWSRVNLLYVRRHISVTISHGCGEVATSSSYVDRRRSCSQSHRQSSDWSTIAVVSSWTGHNSRPIWIAG